MSKHAGYLIQQILAKSGVTHVWGITGDSANYITEAIFESSMTFMHVRHEEAAAFGAAQEALAKENLGVCIGSCGPGALHLLNGLYHAKFNHAPLLCLATHIPKSEIGTSYIQETDVINLFEDCSVFCQYIQDEAQLPRIMGIAMQTALSQRGVAVLIIPSDISSAKVDKTLNLNYLPHKASPVKKADENAILNATRKINQSSRVVIYAGLQAKGYSQEIVRLSEKIKAPICWTLQDNSAYVSQSKFSMGVISEGMDEALKYEKPDLLIALGELPSCLASFAEGNILIQENIDTVTYTNRLKQVIYGEIEDAVMQLTSQVDLKTESKYAMDCHTRYLTLCEESRINDSTFQKIFSQLDTLLPAEISVVIESGELTKDLHTAFVNKITRSYHTSTHYHTSGDAIPMAMGIRISLPTDRLVVGICTYSGILHFLGDLLTLRQMDLAIKLIILPDKNHEDEKIKLSPKITSMATALGITAHSVFLSDVMEDDFGSFFNEDGYGIMEICINPNALQQ